MDPEERRTYVEWATPITLGESGTRPRYRSYLDPFEWTLTAVMMSRHWWKLNSLSKYVEHDVWLGGNVTVLGGVTIGHGSTVGKSHLLAFQSTIPLRIGI